MEKDLKSCTGVLLRSDLIGHSHPTLFLQKLADWLNWPDPVKSAFKRTPVQDFNSFSITFYHIISTTYQKFETYFALLIFLEFCTVYRAATVDFWLARTP